MSDLSPSSSVLAKDNTETLRQLEAEFMKASAEHGSQGYLSYYAEDAVEVPDGAPILQGKESIAKTMGFLDNKQNHLTWTQVSCRRITSREETSGAFDVCARAAQTSNPGAIRNNRLMLKQERRVYQR